MFSESLPSSRSLKSVWALQIINKIRVREVYTAYRMFPSYAPTEHSCFYGFFQFEYLGVESNWAHSALRPPIGLLCQPRVIMMREKLVEWWLAGETKAFGENLPQCHFVHHEPHMHCLDADPGLRGGKPATNRLSYGTALFLRLDRGISPLKTSNGGVSQCLRINLVDRFFFSI
jgi:hypothetical protein